MANEPWDLGVIAKPCAARFTGADPDLVAKAAKLMDLEVREACCARRSP
jgi:hypothetical protein